jgi:hypothetical protein
MVKVETLLVSFAALCAALFAGPLAAQQKVFSTVQHTALVAPNVNADVFVQCPAGQTAYSGGVDGGFVSDLDLMSSAPTCLGSAQILTYSLPDGIRPAPTGWHANVRNRAGDPLPVTISAVCGPTFESAVAVLATFNVEAGTSLTPTSNGIQVSCGPGRFALGGGLDVQFTGSMLVSSSAPTVDGKPLAALPAGTLGAPDGWSAFVRNEGAAGQVRVAAICHGLADTITFNSPKLLQEAQSTMTAYVSCPTGYSLVGGGFDPENRLFQVASASTPFYSAAPTFPSRRPDGEYPGPAGWSADVRNASMQGLPFNVGIVCTATANSSVLTTAFEFYNTTLKHYFRTAYVEEALAIDGGAAGPGWVRTGDNFVGYLPGSNSPGADVCRFYTHGANSHFYTVEVPECTSLKDPNSGWDFEGLAFRIVKPVGGGCPDGTIPVHRLYNNRFMFTDSNHRFTTQSTNIAPMEAEGWIYEGIGFCAVAN